MCLLPMVSTLKPRCFLTPDVRWEAGRKSVGEEKLLGFEGVVGVSVDGNDVFVVHVSPAGGIALKPRCCWC